jgi:hypothetical protein
MIVRVLVQLVLVAATIASPSLASENRLPRDDVRGDAIEGYASEISVLPSETVHFHVQTNPPELYRISIYRLGWYDGGQRQFACVPSWRFGRRGRHVVAVEVSDGYGGRASASSTVAVRR